MIYSSELRMKVPLGVENEVHLDDVVLVLGLRIVSTPKSEHDYVFSRLPVVIGPRQLVPVLGLPMSTEVREVEVVIVKGEKVR